MTAVLKIAGYILIGIVLAAVVVLLQIIAGGEGE